MGNLLSLKFAFQKVGLKPEVGLDRSQIKNADAIAIPGVGSFQTATKKLDQVRDLIIDLAGGGIPVIGICLGLQLFFPESEEGGGQGLGLFKGKNVRLPNYVKVPHMGWNSLKIIKQNKILEGVNDGSYVYFVHSLFPEPTERNIVCTETNYGKTFASTIAKKNVYGTQFHPEKSGDIGLKILRNFAQIVAR